MEKGNRSPRNGDTNHRERRRTFNAAPLTGSLEEIERALAVLAVLDMDEPRLTLALQ